MKKVGKDRIQDTEEKGGKILMKFDVFRALKSFFLSAFESFSIRQFPFASI